jgi:hypothetical protein
MLNKILIFIIMLLSNFTFAADQADGNVKGFFINSDNLGLLKLTKEVTGCGAESSGGWDFSFDTTTDSGKQWVSMLLAARMSASLVRVGYLPAPTQNGTYCSLDYVYFYDF